MQKKSKIHGKITKINENTFIFDYNLLNGINFPSLVKLGLKI